MTQGPGVRPTNPRSPFGSVQGSLGSSGYSSWTVLLPSVLAAGLAVWLLMSTVRRPWGRSAGLISGVVFALTPIVVAMSRSNNPDMVLVCCCVAAAWAVGRGIADGRTRWMLLAGLFCAAGVSLEASRSGHGDAGALAGIPDCGTWLMGPSGRPMRLRWPPVHCGGRSVDCGNRSGPSLPTAVDRNHHRRKRSESCLRVKRLQSTGGHQHRESVANQRPRQADLPNQSARRGSGDLPSLQHRNRRPDYVAVPGCRRERDRWRHRGLETPSP